MLYRCLNRPGRPIEFASDGCLELCGYSRAELENGEVSWGDIINPQDRDRVWSGTQSAVAAGTTYEFEYRIKARSGAERWVWERGQCSDSAADGIARLEGLVTDITNRKATEQALADARAFSEAVVDSAVEAVITIDTRGRIETFNRSAQRMFGYPFFEVAGQNISILMPDPYASEHDGYIRNYLDTHIRRIIGTGREIRARRKDGAIFPIHLSVSEVALHPERKFVGLIRDISQQHAAERAAREHLEQLAHVDRRNMLGEMATGIAHEINQPLTAISLFSQAGKRLLDAGGVDRLPDIFDKLSQHAERAGAIIERMQTMAKRGESVRKTVDCNALITEITELAEAEARLREINIEISTAGKLPLVDVDAVQIQQVALNLLRNGMEAMRAIDCARGNTITVTTGLRDNGDVEIRVIDSGCGVADDTAERLFTPFSTTKDSGMGMGLSLSRTIITAHGGQLDFSNNADGGATFYFTLPAAQEDQ
jgi:two-component system sensor kinase FixL